QTYSHWSPIGGFQCQLQPLSHLLIDVIDRLFSRNIKLANGPTHHIKVAVHHLYNLSAVYRDQSTSLWSYLTDMSSLDLAWKHHPWVLAHLFAFMDMTPRPVLIAFGAQSINCTGGVGFMARLTVQAGMQQADIQELWITLRIVL